MYLSHAAGQSRIFDHIYDPLFVTSGKTDMWRANACALARSAPIHILSNYNQMFSDLPRRPSFSYWRQQNPLPHFPYTKDHDANKENKTRLNVEGHNRPNFFHYPPITTKIVYLQIDTPESNRYRDEIPEDKFKTIGCQTMYRESSAQTQPYMPDAVIADGQVGIPEVLEISKLITGDNQPGDFEARVIERARKRRDFEKKLPKINSAKDWDKRRIVLEAFEWEEWMAREDEINDCQQIRLDLVEQLMAKREHQFRKTSSAKIENTTKRIEALRNKKIANLRCNHARALRKLEMKHKNLSRKYKKPDIITEHLDKSSDLYGPQMRYGVHPKRRHFIASKSQFQARLENLEMKLNKSSKLECPITKRNYLTKPKEKKQEILRGFCKDKHLKNLYDTLKNLRDKKTDTITSDPKCLKELQIEKALHAETPIGIEEDIIAETEYQRCIVLQKTIKGRAIQNILIAGRNRSRGLIDEIKTTQQLSAVSAMYPGMSNDIMRRRIAVLAQQKRLRKIMNCKKNAKEIYAETEAETIGFLLNFLEKELRRLHDQRKAHALCMLAERERMKREAAEAGRRQIENQRRSEHDEIYRNLIKSSNDTATMYLENILIEETKLAGDQNAHEYIKGVAKRIDQEANREQKRKNKPEKKFLDDEDIVTELVKNFVYPEVHKRLAHRNMEMRQKKHLLVAHKTLYQHIHETFENQETEKTVNDILRELINRVIASDENLSELSSTEDIAEHEALVAIKRIIRLSFPSTESSTEEMAGISSRTSREHSEYDWLMEIINEINDKLWEYALQDKEESSESIENEESEESEVGEDFLVMKETSEFAIHTLSTTTNVVFLEGDEKPETKNMKKYEPKKSTEIEISNVESVPGEINQDQTKLENQNEPKKLVETENSEVTKEKPEIIITTTSADSVTGEVNLNEIKSSEIQNMGENDQEKSAELENFEATKETSEFTIHTISIVNVESATGEANLNEIKSDDIQNMEDYDQQKLSEMGNSQFTINTISILNVGSEMENANFNEIRSDIQNMEDYDQTKTSEMENFEVTQEISGFTIDSIIAEAQSVVNHELSIQEEINENSGEPSEGNNKDVIE